VRDVTREQVEALRGAADEILALAKQVEVLEAERRAVEDALDRCADPKLGELEPTQAGRVRALVEAHKVLYFADKARTRAAERDGSPCRCGWACGKTHLDDRDPCPHLLVGRRFSRGDHVATVCEVFERDGEASVSYTTRGPAGGGGGAAVLAHFLRAWEAL
jgi:hypothetical protein